MHLDRCVDDDLGYLVLGHSLRLFAPWRLGALALKSEILDDVSCRHDEAPSDLTSCGLTPSVNVTSWSAGREAARRCVHAVTTCIHWTARSRVRRRVRRVAPCSLASRSSAALRPAERAPPATWTRAARSALSEAWATADGCSAGGSCSGLWRHEGMSGGSDHPSVERLEILITNPTRMSNSGLPMERRRCRTSR
jgi:hypothetical protein